VAPAPPTLFSFSVCRTSTIFVTSKIQRPVKLTFQYEPVHSTHHLAPSPVGTVITLFDGKSFVNRRMSGRGTFHVIDGALQSVPSFDRAGVFYSYLPDERRCKKTESSAQPPVHHGEPATPFPRGSKLLREIDLPPVTDRNAARRIQRPDPPSMRLHADTKWR
jgi:hypothetical protein